MTVHLDEKWFACKPNGVWVRMLPGQAPPKTRRVTSKGHLPKVMIIAVVAEPDAARGFDGKIGVWRCAVQVAYKTGSRAAEGKKRWVDQTLRACAWTDEKGNRIKGFRDFMMKDIMPAIRRKMPWYVVCRCLCLCLCLSDAVHPPSSICFAG